MPVAASHICPRCGMPAVKLRRCTGCKKAIYCSQKCQKEAWPLHIFDCQPGQPINTAYRLYRACLRDEIPDDEETRRDFGFAKAARTMGGMSENMLAGLFRGVFVYLDVPPKVVHTWRLEGRLMAEIKNLYEPILPQNRGAYYPWLLEHQSVLDEASSDDELIVDHVARVIRSAWIKSGGSPSDSLNVIQTKILNLSLPRQACHVLYRGFLGGGHPNPSQHLWRDFGFVAAMNSIEERDLSAAYQAVMKVCTFEEFCIAHETSSIPALFARYGLQCTRLFRDVMAHSPYMRKSVWSLKHYVDQLAAGDPVDRSPSRTPSVDVDYGFANCRDNADITQLNAVYKRYFSHPRADPLALHTSCIQGRLLYHLAPIVNWKKRQNKTFARLLKTVYPLSQPVNLAGMAHSNSSIAIHLVGSDMTSTWWQYLSPGYPSVLTLLGFCVGALALAIVFRRI